MWVYLFQRKVYTDAGTYIHTYTSNLELRLEKPMMFLTETTFLKEKTQQSVSIHFIHSSQHPHEVWICHLNFSYEVRKPETQVNYIINNNFSRKLKFVVHFWTLKNEPGSMYSQFFQIQQIGYFKNWQFIVYNYSSRHESLKLLVLHGSG